jgi:MATE family multidrug resistance protein
LCLIISFAWFNLNGAAFGDVTLAANAILMQMIQVLAYGLDGFAHAAETLVGSAIGAGRRDQYRWAIRVTTQWAVGTALVYTSVFWLFGADFVALITSIDAVRLMADSYLPWLIAIPLISVWSYQLDGIFVGSLRTADMRNAMMVSTGVYMALSLPLIAWAENHGLWLAISLYFLLRALTLGWLLRTGQWNERAITSGGPLH